MTAVENVRARNGLWWLGAVAIPVGSMVAIVAADTSWSELGRLSALARARVFANAFLVEAAMLVCGAPLAGVVFGTRAQRAGPRNPRERGISIVVDAWRIARPLMVGAGVLVLTSALLALVLNTMTTSTLVVSHLILWTITMSLASLGATCASVFRDRLDAAACAVGMSLIVAVGLFAAGPVLDEMPSRVLDVALFANPIIAVAASANIDIVRSGWLYQLSPLAHIQITYPATGPTVAAYGLTATMLFLGAARLNLRRVNDVSIERMSA